MKAFIEGSVSVHICSYAQLRTPKEISRVCRELMGAWQDLMFSTFCTYTDAWTWPRVAFGGNCIQLVTLYGSVRHSAPRSHGSSCHHCKTINVGILVAPGFSINSNLDVHYHYLILLVSACIFRYLGLSWACGAQWWQAALAKVRPPWRASHTT